MMMWLEGYVLSFSGANFFDPKQLTILEENILDQNLQLKKGKNV